MALSRKYIEFDITGNNLTVGSPVGYEADFSADPLFKEIRSSISTFNSLDENQANKIYYNINGESTWNLFPYGQEGVTFNDPYKIRVETTPIDTGYILIESSGVLNKVRCDFNSIISSSNIFSTNISSEVLGIEVNNKNSECFILTNDNIIVTNYNNSNDLKKRRMSLLNNRVFAISLDSARETFWQINSDSICLRNLFGEKLFCVPISIDDELSSSSSSNSSSSNSSSSSSYSSNSSKSVSSSSSSSSSSKSVSSDSSDSSISSNRYSSSSSSTNSVSSDSSISSISSKGYSSSSSSKSISSGSESSMSGPIVLSVSGATGSGAVINGSYQEYGTYGGYLAYKKKNQNWFIRSEINIDGDQEWYIYSPSVSWYFMKLPHTPPTSAYGYYYPSYGVISNKATAI